jgi:2-keto-3-deoxy-L-rhamnonate aldolase RhmA
MSTTLSLKQRIRAGEVVVGLRATLGMSRSQVEDIWAGGSYDFLHIDGQHVAYGEDQLVAFCALAEELNIPVQFRIPHTRHAYLIGRYLDLGPTAIMVPEVEDEATAAEAVAYAYYPQVGRRSWGGAARLGVRAQGGQADRLSYAAWWNETVVLTLQLESVTAITNARRLAKPGVDLLAFGPNDLQFSLEGHPDYPLRTVDACMRNVAAQVAGTGVRLAMGTTTLPGERDKYLEMGVTVFQELPKR